MAKSSAVLNPNAGLFFNRAALSLPAGALQDGMNFRVKNGKLTNINLGWERFGTFQLNGPITHVDSFTMRSGVEHLMFFTDTDAYLYVDDDTVRFITPVYVTGTASASGTTVTGTGTTWSDFINEGDEISFGSNTEDDPEADWFEIDNVGGNTTLTLTTSAGTVANGDYTIRRRFSHNPSTDIWQSAVFMNADGTDDKWFGTNGGIQPIIEWDGTTQFMEYLDNIGFRCKTLAVYQNMLIYGNIVDQSGTDKPTDIINSNVGEPTNVSTGLAEQFKVHGGQDHIYTLKPLGDVLSIYSQFTVTITQFVGGDLIFIFRNVINEVGPVGPKAIADHGDWHEFIGSDSAYRFDGVTVKETSQHVWREYIRQQQPSKIKATYSHFDDENGDLIWSVRLTTDTSENAPAKALIKHYLEEVTNIDRFPHSLRAFPFTAMGYWRRNTGVTWDTLTQAWQDLTFRWNDKFFAVAFPFNIAGDENGKLFQINTSQTADGVNLVSFVRFGRRALFDGKIRGLLTRVYPFIEPSTGDLDVTVRLMDHGAGAPTITAEETISQSLPEGGHFASIYRRGRFAEMEFGSAGNPYTIVGYDMDVRSGGKR